MGTQAKSWAFPADWSVARGRDTYLAQNGFELAGYDEKVSHVLYMGLNIPVPNTQKRRWAIRLHDLHHVATGFGTDPIGEAEISAWEIRSGLLVLGPYVGGIVTSGVLAGMLMDRERTIAAWRAAEHARSLFSLRGLQIGASFDEAYAKLLTLSIAELRRLLGVPERGIATYRPGLHAAAPVHAHGIPQH